VVAAKVEAKVEVVLVLEWWLKVEVEAAERNSGFCPLPQGSFGSCDYVTGLSWLSFRGWCHLRRRATNAARDPHVYKPR